MPTVWLRSAYICRWTAYALQVTLLGLWTFPAIVSFQMFFLRMIVVRTMLTRISASVAAVLHYPLASSPLCSVHARGREGGRRA
eukprot:COSAG01_NODE_5372_length_4300_cov_2310.826511_7_plen_84_part_00